MERSLASNWWMLAIRGALAIAFGVAVLFWPGLAWVVIVGLFAGYALLDGAFAIAAAVTGHNHGRQWWALVLEGIVGLAAGFLTLLWPDVTELILLYLIAFWAITTGAMEIAVAVRLRRDIAGEWALGLAGVLSIVFGLMALLIPAAGALAVAWLIAAYAISFGALLLIVALRLRGGPRGPTTRVGAV
ncbi:HdeD family acid-resistance protein [Frigoriglobus tundricola]|uniref:HdeD family acid-resistance protein n=1 Tax=Frigoriglobus tundricola TaxID=2774151 RepID=A0A6M5Z0T4_9BACT|nr:HdeD family acid-resistance protein [Frigoriglobus tundricola]QJW99250.1 hypothetical protein FTUN_6852 [Frigoriglobus tundricola]